MKTKQPATKKLLDLRSLYRIIPVLFLILAFSAVNYYLYAQETTYTEPYIDSSDAVTTRNRLQPEILNDVDMLPVNMSAEPDLNGQLLVAKKFTFEKISEDMAVTETVTEFGFTLKVINILLTRDNVEETIIKELSTDDFDIAYLPYRETVSVVWSNKLFASFSSENIKSVFSYGGENIGLINNSYPASGLFYNKKIIAEAGLSDPMELLERGEWDLDMFYLYLEKTSQDKDKDGINDIFGIVINEDLTDNLAAANGISIVSTDSNGELKLEISGEGFSKVLEFINAIYSKGFKGGMSKQGFIDGRACFYNDDASTYTELDSVMNDEIGFISYPSDSGLVVSASSHIEIAVINPLRDTSDKALMEKIRLSICPGKSAEEHFSGIFSDQAIVELCARMTLSNYVSPIHLFPEIRDYYLDMLRDIKAGVKSAGVS